MNKKFRIGQKGNVITLTDRNYLSAGGEGAIYINGNQAYKIYHDSKRSLPPKKIQELSSITDPCVMVPRDIIYDNSTGESVGYTTEYVKDGEPLLKLFTRTFKQDNNIDNKQVSELVKKMQLITISIHSSKILVVDYNELNILVKLSSELFPYYIDTDSYQTPSFKSSAVMNSIMDRRCSSIDNKGILHYKPDEFADWYSWGILTFWLYTNIHPFRGNHPSYRPKDKQKQMDDGISVFHKDVKIPGCVTLKTMPKRHEDWFRDTFLDNHRSIPPLADSSVPLTVPSAIITVKGNDRIDVVQVGSFNGDITYVTQFMGVDYVVTKKVVSSGGKEMMDTTKFKKVLVCPSNDGTMIAASLLGTKVTFSELNTGVTVGTIFGTDMFARNGCTYTITNGKLVENSFTTLGNKTIHRIIEVENVSQFGATMYRGCVIQDLLGKFYLTLPIKKGSCFSKYIPQLDGYRIIDCKSDKFVTVIIGEHKGQYDRFIIVFNKDYTSFDVRKIDDVAPDPINFTTMESGLCVLLASQTELELFVNNKNAEVLNDPPFDSTMRLYSTSDGIYFINGNTTHKISKK